MRIRRELPLARSIEAPSAGSEWIKRTTLVIALEAHHSQEMYDGSVSKHVSYTFHERAGDTICGISCIRSIYHTPASFNARWMTCRGHGWTWGRDGLRWRLCACLPYSKRETMKMKTRIGPNSRTMTRSNLILRTLKNSWSKSIPKAWISFVWGTDSQGSLCAAQQPKPDHAPPSRGLRRCTRRSVPRGGTDPGSLPRCSSALKPIKILCPNACGHKCLLPDRSSLRVGGFVLGIACLDT